MKRLRHIYLLVIVLYILSAVLVNVCAIQENGRSESERNVLINRIASAVSKAYDEGQEDISDIIASLYFEKLSEYEEEYGPSELPQNILFLDLQRDHSKDLKESEKQRITQLQSADGTYIGFLLFLYDDSTGWKQMVLINIGFILGFLIFAAFALYINNAVLSPFEALSDYPEKLSKGVTVEKLPETKHRYFGKFIWGINMLSDRLAQNDKQVKRMMQEKQTLLTTLAHGIKTPIANVKLYASAIETGLYRPGGVADEEDAVIAAKINKNADAITTLVKEILDTTSKGMVSFEPKIEAFYVTEIVDYLRAEYDNRLRTLHIPYTIVCETNAMIESDQVGVRRILTQLLDNAIKYGNGEGISVQLEKSEEGFFFSVKNKGKLLSEDELPSVFKSFWRGSNAGFVEGNGIGLFEARTIALKLGGDIMAKCHEETGEMEFVVYIENERD